MRALLAVFAHFLGGILLCDREHPINRAGHDHQPQLRCRRGVERRSVIKPALGVGPENGADYLVLLKQHPHRSASSMPV
jgi:hypothetical protein